MCDCEACFISFETEKNRPPSGVQAAARQAGRGLSRPASVASHGIYMKRAARLNHAFFGPGTTAEPFCRLEKLGDRPIFVCLQT